MKWGFTLVELLIVIVVVAVVAAIAVPQLSQHQQRAHDSSLKSKLRTVREAIERCRADNGGIPLKLGDLTRDTPQYRLKRKDGVLFFATNWKGPYLDPTTAKVDANANLIDPVCGGTFAYNTSTGPNFGRVTACATGTATDGTNYQDW